MKVRDNGTTRRYRATLPAAASTTQRDKRTFIKFAAESIELDVYARRYCVIVTVLRGLLLIDVHVHSGLLLLLLLLGISPRTRGTSHFGCSSHGGNYGSASAFNTLDHAPFVPQVVAQAPGMSEKEMRRRR